ncbi:MAG: hypothetical protein GY839_03515 [candidate division Zixibacteria bacterium]|nr:hypothetical protein [candidate division Zixibacteria bacterium]
MTDKKVADLSNVVRYSVRGRKTKSNTEKFAGTPRSIKSFFDSLPDFLKATDLKNLAADIIKAKRRNKAIVWMMGAHPLKIGLSPVINDLIKNGYITHLGLNGAGVIHDLEIAFWGRTSEEVAETLGDGSFGMVEETPTHLSQALAKSDKDCGIGESVGGYISELRPKYASYSVLTRAFQTGIPVSVHIAIGTDTICQHPEFDAALWGHKSHIDFKLMAEKIRKLHKGGVVVNFGSAVIMPEVFLKALTVARNLYGDISSFSAANFDMIQHYRPNLNVVQRPTIMGGKRYSFTGHHEIMMPLLAAAIKSLHK